MKKFVFVFLCLIFIFSACSPTEINTPTIQVSQTIHALTETATLAPTMDFCVDISIIKNALIFYKRGNVDSGFEIVSRDIYNNEVNAFPMPNEVVDFTVSPNGKYILYLSSTNAEEIITGNNTLYWGYADDSNFSILTETPLGLYPPAETYSPVWGILSYAPAYAFSSNGKYLALAIKNENDISSLGIFDLQHKAPLIPDNILNVVASEEKNLTNNDKTSISHLKFKWSPNGEYLAIVVAEANQLNIYLYQPSTQEINLIEQFPLTINIGANNILEYSKIDFLWAENNSSLAIIYANVREQRGVFGRGGQIQKINLYNLNSKSSSYSTVAENTFSTPIISPDGSKLAYGTVQESKPQIRVINSNGQETILPLQEGYDVYLDGQNTFFWSPDSSSIIWLGYVPKQGLYKTFITETSTNYTQVSNVNLALDTDPTTSGRKSNFTTPYGILTLEIITRYESTLGLIKTLEVKELIYLTDLDGKKITFHEQIGTGVSTNVQFSQNKQFILITVNNGFENEATKPNPQSLYIDLKNKKVITEKGTLLISWSPDSRFTMYYSTYTGQIKYYDHCSGLGSSYTNSISSELADDATPIFTWR